MISAILGGVEIEVIHIKCYGIHFLLSLRLGGVIFDKTYAVDVSRKWK